MILNDLSREPQLTRSWVEEIDRRLTDETGHQMLAYGDEIVVQRRRKTAWLRIPWQKMADELFAMAHPMDMHAEPTDGTDFYLNMLVNLIKQTVKECADD